MWGDDEVNKTDEELNLAEAMAKRYGVRMCDENGDTHGEELYCVGIDDIADIIREALADPEKQEPVAEYLGFSANLNHVFKLDADIPVGTKLYAAPVSAKREWVDLTDYEIVRLYDESPMCDSEMIAFARAVITAFKEKNK